MSLNPFKINNVIETNRFPLARFKRRPLLQKFKDTFFVIAGDLQDIGLIDWFTLFIPKLASIIMLIPLFILLSALAEIIFHDPDDEEETEEVTSHLSWLSIVVLSILSIPAVLFVPPLLISWLIISSILTLISLPITTLVHAIFYKNHKDVLEEIRFEDGQTLQNFMENTNASIENLETEFRDLDNYSSYHTTFNLLTYSAANDKNREHGYQLNFCSNNQSKHLKVRDEITHKTIKKLCEANIGQISACLEKNNNLDTFLNDPLPTYQHTY